MKDGLPIFLIRDILTGYALLFGNYIIDPSGHDIVPSPHAARDKVILITDNKAVVRMYVYRNMYTHNNNYYYYYYYYCMIHLFPDLVDTSASCYYPGDKRKHFRGAIWHPYVPPFGFMPCAVCQCSVSFSINHWAIIRRLDHGMSGILVLFQRSNDPDTEH